jgi:hypothetical protein
MVLLPMLRPKESNNLSPIPILKGVGITLRKILIESIFFDMELGLILRQHSSFRTE